MEASLIPKIMGFFCRFTSGDDYAASFLIENGADINACTPLDKVTGLHLVAQYEPSSCDEKTIEGMASVSRQLLKHGANPNAKDQDGRYMYIYMRVSGCSGLLENM